MVWRWENHDSEDDIAKMQRKANERANKNHADSPSGCLLISLTLLTRVGLVVLVAVAALFLTGCDDVGSRTAETVSGDQVEPAPVPNDGVIQEGEQCGGVSQEAC